MKSHSKNHPPTQEDMMGRPKNDPLARQRGETHKDWQLRIALAGVVNDDDKDRNAPSVFTAQHGDYREQFVTHVESGKRSRAVFNRESTVLEQWLRQGGPGYDEGARRAIADCQLFWGRMGEQRVTARYGERTAPSTGDAGYSAQEASDEIAHRKRMFPRQFWDVFENVVRHNEPAGVAGSRFANNRPQQIASAKAIVGMVASMMAARLGY